MPAHRGLLAHTHHADWFAHAANQTHEQMAASLTRANQYVLRNSCAGSQGMLQQPAVRLHSNLLAVSLTTKYHPDRGVRVHMHC